MPVIKSKITTEFTTLKNKLLNDTNLSFKARGLLAFMLSLPSDWKFYSSEIVKHSNKDGQASINSAIKELKENGYLEIRQVFKDGKFSGNEWIVYDYPKLKSTDVDFPHAEKPNTEKPSAGNHSLQRTNSTKKHNTNKNSIKDTMSSSDEHDDISTQVIDYLNEKADRHFRNTAANKRLINARVKEGFELKDFKRAIDTKTAQWSHDTKMSKYLRPVTLFNASKFEGYVNEQQLPQGTNAKRGLNVRETLPDWAQDGYEYQPKQKVTAEDIKLEEGELPF